MFFFLSFYFDDCKRNEYRMQNSTRLTASHLGELGESGKCRSIITKPINQWKRHYLLGMRNVNRCRKTRRVAMHESRSESPKLFNIHENVGRQFNSQTKIFCRHHYSWSSPVRGRRLWEYNYMELSRIYQLSPFNRICRLRLSPTYYLIGALDIDTGPHICLRPISSRTLKCRP